MKLIIDIPDEVFERIKSVEDYYFRVLDDNKRVLFPALKNGIPLDDIKAEIEELYKRDKRINNQHGDMYQENYRGPFGIVLDIIDKHIGES